MMRTFSFGAGVQSTAVLALQAMGRLPEPYDVFLFANVGDDSEHPDSLAYFRDVHMPFAEEHGIDLQEVKRVKRDGTSPTLLEYTLQDKRSIRLPMYLQGGGPGNRTWASASTRYTGHAPTPASTTRCSTIHSSTSG